MEGRWNKCCPGESVFRMLGACCWGEKMSKIRAPSWMVQEIEENFAGLGNVWPSQARIIEAEKVFGKHLCRLKVLNGTLQVGKTPGCHRPDVGPLIVHSIIDA